jgi:hypothetical protein
MANYPASLPSASPATHGVEADEVVAIATELGTDPAGTYTDVKTRLGASTGQWSPEQHGLLSWAFDPHLIGGNVVLSPAGQMYTFRLFTQKDITVTNMWLYVVTVGVTLTSGNCRVALFDSGGTYITNSISADQSVAWVSTGAKSAACGSPVAVAAGFFDVGFWYNGTTGPAFGRLGSGTGAGSANLNLAGNAIRSAQTNQTGLTTTAPGTTGTKTAHANSIWVGVS